ncbi:MULTISPECIES: dephospho-CoA kinase [Marinomonas]|uniref:Dephospho-CoA kinase n=1 Tax=Marinomonas aquiplantarum TaxID=491951 RepID=A0A366CVG8_9GAMM|nr:dephospho-CoA kinase [Marinomonas aquiplantarum]RBO79662.1 dephospho-CoA kinase [Marinomonas aquiplantarum]
MAVVPIIGLAGGIGSGKSTIAALFNQLGIESIDADDVARQVVELGTPALNKIHQRFGDAILLTDGTLNRRALRHIIFSQPEEKAWLESVTHPAIRESLDTALKKATSAYVLLVHPLLFETQQNKMCRYVVAIDTPKEIQIQRVMSRDRIDEETTLNIINSQLSNQDRLDKADLVLENAGNINEMNDKVLKMHETILRLIK